MSLSILEIDSKHIGHIPSASGISREFVPGIYKSLGSARNAMKNIMEMRGYVNLSQEEKETIGRWYLLYTDQTELDLLFDDDEQQEIETFISKYTKTISSNVTTTVTSDLTIDTTSGITSYIVRDTFTFKGEHANDILSIKISAYTESGTSYSVRIFDSETNSVVAEKIGNTNTLRQIIDLGSILYVPIANTTLEVQIRRDTATSGKIYYLSTALDYV